MIYRNNIKILFLPLFIFSNPVDADFRSWFLMVPAAVVTVSLSTVKWFLNTGLKLYLNKYFGIENVELESFAKENNDNDVSDVM